MRPVEIAGWGLSTHLGRGPACHLLALRDNRPRLQTLRLDEFGEPFSVPLLMSPSAGWTEPMARMRHMLCEATDDALRMAQVSDARRRGLPLYLGSSSFAIGILERNLRERGGDPVAAAADGHLPLAGYGEFLDQIAAMTGVDGPDRVFNTACTASANAVLHAARAIASGRIEQALVIGIELANYTTLAGFAGMQLLAPGAMRPFDRNRDGLVLGEGCAALLLRAGPEDAALRIRGGASRCDTFSISASNPDGGAIAAVMAEALANTGLAPEELAAIKGHGTASPLNDNGEAAGLTRLFGAQRPPLFLLKALLGHTLGACGAIETALLAVALQAGLLPGSAGCTEPDPALGTAPQQQPQVARPGSYLLNFFGFGGNNCALVLDWRGSASMESLI